MDSAPGLLIEQRDSRLAITLNRPTMANSLRAEDRLRLIEVLEAASRSASVRVVTIAANGRQFCGGLDLRASRPPSDEPPGYPGGLAAGMRNAQALINAVLNCGKPVVAIVQGPAAGMGLYLALASDAIVASTEAVFVETFVHRAMVLHCGGAHLLVSRMGMQKAKEFVLFGGRIGAEEADRIGLLCRLTSPDRLAEEADAVAATLAAGPTLTLGLSKRLLNDAVGADRGRAFADEVYAWESNTATRDREEGRDAFRERREPEFVGW